MKKGKDKIELTKEELKKKIKVTDEDLSFEELLERVVNSEPEEGKDEEE